MCGEPLVRRITAVDYRLLAPTKEARRRVIEAIETLVRMHTAQEEDIYESVVARTSA